MRKLLMGAIAAGAMAMAGSAGAATFSYSTSFNGSIGPEWTVVAPHYQQLPNILGAMSNPGTGGSATLSQTSVGASTSALNGSLTFDLLGFTSIDGAFGCCEDRFTLTINGATVYQAAFAMQHFSDNVYINTNGATYQAFAGVRRITVPFSAIVGANSFVFDYGPLQGIGDESWGLDDVSFSAEVNDPRVPNGVPEPATWAMLIGGFAGMGAMLRRRRTSAAAA